MQYSPRDLEDLRESQLNALAAAGVYAVAWIVLQVALKLLAVDMPLLQTFDSYGNLSFAGLLVFALWIASAFLPHWLLLRRMGVSGLEAARLVREFRELRNRLVPTEDDPAWGGGEPSWEPVGDTDYWQRRWRDFNRSRPEDDPGPPLL